MESVHCQRSCEESCQQKQQHSSLGQKVSELFKGQHHSNTQTQCPVQSQGAECHGRSGRQHKKKNLLQKIKDTFSSDSSSDDESDHENCHSRKN